MVNICIAWRRRRRLFYTLQLSCTFVAAVPFGIASWFCIDTRLLTVSNKHISLIVSLRDPYTTDGNAVLIP